MDFDFRKTYAKYTTDSLLGILHKPTAYLPAAVEAATAELEQRGIGGDELQRQLAALATAEPAVVPRRRLSLPLPAGPVAATVLDEIVPAAWSVRQRTGGWWMYVAVLLCALFSWAVAAFFFIRYLYLVFRYGYFELDSFLAMNGLHLVLLSTGIYSFYKHHRLGYTTLALACGYPTLSCIWAILFTTAQAGFSTALEGFIRYGLGSPRTALTILAFGLLQHPQLRQEAGINRQAWGRALLVAVGGFIVFSILSALFST